MENKIVTRSYLESKLVEIFTSLSVSREDSLYVARALIQAVPIPDPDFVGNDDLPLKSMQLASLEGRGEGCAFIDRCLYSCDQCREKVCYQQTDTAKVLCNNLSAVPSAPIYDVTSMDNH